MSVLFPTEAGVDAVQEVIANAAVANVRLVELEKTALAYPTVLARYGIAQVRDGRRVGARRRITPDAGGDDREALSLRRRPPDAVRFPPSHREATPVTRSIRVTVNCQRTNAATVCLHFLTLAAFTASPRFIQEMHRYPRSHPNVNRRKSPPDGSFAPATPERPAAVRRWWHAGVLASTRGGPRPHSWASGG